MLKNSLIVIFTLLSQFTFAQSSRELFNEANDLYAKKNYEEAAKKYEAIVANGFESSALYYNLGNAYFKTKNIPSAILYYEKAALLDPSNDDIVFNLELARTYTIDKIEPIPQFFLVSMVKWFRGLFSANTWAIIAIIAFLIALVCFGLFWFATGIHIRRTSFYFAIILFVAFGFSIYFSVSAKNQIVNHRYAIVFSPVISVKSSPDDSGSDLFILHEGTKVEVLRSVGEWSEVQIADGNKGWLHNQSFKKI